ncbi:hypothetical protein [Arthrobacter sp. H35-D1]|uniref:hypothetical protein n=1 Tax=Arthrobacter sp. H35-D1 TaxID=3046202 RepID=UPI0024BA3F77|nr:hypothetical protein [Arthrobacter sp. H35-D1]MDJ0314026.1 hypothetical protein [Arthrobacter sp. H35-D1]
MARKVSNDIGSPTAGRATAADLMPLEMVFTELGLDLELPAKLNRGQVDAILLLESKSGTAMRVLVNENLAAEVANQPRRGLPPAAKVGQQGPSQTAVRLVEDIVNMTRSIAALGPAISSLEVPTSPPLAAAIQATENLWARIEDRWGLLKSTEVATLLGAKTGTRSLPSTLRQKNQLIGVKRRNAFVYPGFQFDRKTGTVHPVIPELLAAARTIGLDHEDLVYWLCSPSTYFDHEQPVEHLSTDPELADKFLHGETVSW